MKTFTGKVSTRPRKYRAEAQALTLVSKLKVENGDVVFAKDLKLPDYGIEWQEACLFALIVDDFKNDNYFRAELVVGRFNYFSLSQVYVDLHELQRKNLIFNDKSGGWYPAWANPKDIFELKQKNANVIKAIDFIISQDKRFNSSKNSLEKILDFLLYWSDVDVCKHCKFQSLDDNDCTKAGAEVYKYCRKGLIEQIANGTLSPNGKGGAK